MKKKLATPKSRIYQVTFELPPEVNAQTANLCGEFNAWDEMSLPMKRRGDGGFSLTVSLKKGRAYRFRYLLDGHRWENDPAADVYVPNPFGSEDSVVELV
jgi:1,4-alpha-glucan branching enzyme